MQKKCRFIMIVILCFVFGAGTLASSSETNYLSSFTYVTGPLTTEGYFDAWFSDDINSTSEDPAFTEKPLDLSNLKEPQIFLVVERINNVTVDLTFTQFKKEGYNPIDYKVTVTPQYPSNSTGFEIDVNSDSESEHFSITDNPGTASKFRSVYGFIYDFGNELDNAVPSVEYESTITVTVSEGV